MKRDAAHIFCLLRRSCDIGGMNLLVMDLSLSKLFPPILTSSDSVSGSSMLCIIFNWFLSSISISEKNILLSPRAVSTVSGIFLNTGIGACIVPKIQEVFPLHSIFQKIELVFVPTLFSSQLSPKNESIITRIPIFLKHTHIVFTKSSVASRRLPESSLESPNRSIFKGV